MAERSEQDNKEEAKATEKATRRAPNRQADNRMAPATKGPTPPTKRLKLVAPDYDPSTSNANIGGMHLTLPDNRVAEFRLGQVVELSADDYKAVKDANLRYPFQFEEVQAEETPEAPEKSESERE
jgi:hypothetical protein